VHSEDGARSLTDDALGGRPHEKSFEKSMPMPADDDQVGVPFFRRLQNFVGRGSTPDKHINGGPGSTRKIQGVRGMASDFGFELLIEVVGNCIPLGDRRRLLKRIADDVKHVERCGKRLGRRTGMLKRRMRARTEVDGD